MRSLDRVETERIQKQLQESSKSLADGYDAAEAAYPTYRKTMKEKWTSRQNFEHRGLP